MCVILRVLHVTTTSSIPGIQQNHHVSFSTLGYPPARKQTLGLDTCLRCSKNRCTPPTLIFASRGTEGPHQPPAPARLVICFMSSCMACCFLNSTSSVVSCGLSALKRYLFRLVSSQTQGSRPRPRHGRRHEIHQTRTPNNRAEQRSARTKIHKVVLRDMWPPGQPDQSKQKYQTSVLLTPPDVFERSYKKLKRGATTKK